MAKLELKGMILTVNKPEIVGEKLTPKQLIILKIPAWRDDYGDVRGKDEEWPIAIMGENVAKLNLTTDHQGKKAKLTVYVNGQKYIKQSDSTEGWIINATLNTIEFAEERPSPASTPVNNATSSNPGW